MQATGNRLVCHAHNRFSPALVLWQHFVAPNQPGLPRKRQSSTGAAAGQVHNGDSSFLDSANPQDPIPLQASTPDQETPSAPETSMSTSDQAPTITYVADRPQDDDKFPRKTLFFEARAAVRKGEDYTGVVIPPIFDTCDLEPDLPWLLKPEERTMQGMDRCGICTKWSRSTCTYQT